MINIKPSGDNDWRRQLPLAVIDARA